MKYFVAALLFATVLSQTCPAASGFEETKAGELAYAFCDEGEWGYKVNYCTDSSNPIWLAMEDICTPISKLRNPPFGYNMLEYNIEVNGMAVKDFTPKIAYMIHTALYNISSAYVIDPIDVVVISAENKNNVTVLTIHQKVDFYNRAALIETLVSSSKNLVLDTLLGDLDDIFLEMFFYIDENSFHYNSFNIFLNPYWDMLFGLIIVVIIWYGLCKLGRKMCAKREAKKNGVQEPLV